MNTRWRVLDDGYRLSLVRPLGIYGDLGEQTVTHAVQYLYGWAVKYGTRRWVHVPDKAAAQQLLYNIGAGGSAS